MTLSTQKNNVYIVLGMSRSGTSAIARSLEALGVNLGDQLLQGDTRNPKGFYEDADILYKINRGVSAALNYQWLDLDTTDKQIEADVKLRDYKNYAVGLLCEKFMTTSSWGFKDPRTVTILPFWQSVFQTLDVDERYVLVIRNPLAAAHSNNKFTDLDLEGGLLLWIKILMQMIDGTHDKKRIIVNYELMLENPSLQLERMHRDLNVREPLDRGRVNQYATQFLDKKLRHHQFDEVDFRTHPAVMVAPICIKMYDLVMKLARDEITFESEQFKNDWCELKDEYARINPVHAYIELLQRRNKQLSREVRTIRKSFPYKLIYPLRMIDDALRGFRKKSRNRSREIYEVE